MPPLPSLSPLLRPFVLSLFIGFTPGAKELFKQENHLALYRLPSAETVKETALGRPSCVTKRRPPLSHMISLFIKDTATSKPHLSSAGIQTNLLAWWAEDYTLSHLFKWMLDSSPSLRSGRGWACGPESQRRGL